MDMRAVASLIDERLGRERGPQPVAVSDGPHGLPIEDLAVGGFERRRVADRQLLLAVAELRVVLLDRNALRLERGHDVVHHGRRRRHPDGGEAETLVQRHEPAVGLLHGQREFAFEGRAHAEPCRGAGGDLALEEGARARLPRRPLQRAHVARHGRRVRRVRKHGERLRIGDEPDLADGAQALDGLELVQHVHRLHGHREPDAVGQPMRQPVHVRGLPPGDAAIVGVEKAHEADAGSTGLRGQVGTGAAGTRGWPWRA